jgi:hypothetical protein
MAHLILNFCRDAIDRTSTFFMGAIPNPSSAVETANKLSSTPSGLRIPEKDARKAIGQFL